MKRIKTFIPGLDRLLEGGYPKGSSILLKGDSGTGKTIFSLQYLYKGIIEENRSGIYIQLDDFGNTLGWYEESFDWNIKSVQEQQKMVIYSFKPKDYEKFIPEKIGGEILSKLKNIITPLRVNRVVIDNITPMRRNLDKSTYEESLYKMIEAFKEMGVTTIFVSDEEDGFEKQLFDGVIELRNNEVEEGRYEKEFIIKKMVATNYPMNWYPASINSRLGFTVRPFL